MVAPGGLFEIAFDEAEVRRLAGAGAFERADAWQREGHVGDASVERRRLTGTVQGTFMRVDDVQVEPDGQKLKGVCSCGRPGVCVHAAALMLHWLRQPAAFAPALAYPGASAAGGRGPLALGAADEDELDDGDLAEDDAEVTAQDALVGNQRELLERYTLAQLREVARRRGVRGASKGRAELLELLPPLLAAPESVDAALAELGADERLLLQTIYLLGSELATSTHAGHAYRALGGPRHDPPLAALVDRALAIPPSNAVPGPLAYAVPQGVAARLPHLADLAQPLPAPHRTPGAADQGLDALQMIVLLAAEVSRGRLQPHYPSVPPALRGVLPPGWLPAVPGEVERQQAGGYRRGRDAVRLIPAPAPLADADLARLARAAGRPPECLALVFELCRALGVITAGASFAVEGDLFQALLALPTLQRLALLAGSLLGLGYPAELYGLLGKGGPLQFSYYPGYFGQQPLLHYQMQRLRGFVYRALRLLPPGTWHEFGALLESLRAWVPWQTTELSFAHRAPGHPLWWVADPKAPDEPLPLDNAAGWRRVYGALVQHLLTGPLTWLGVVETHGDSRGLQAIRVLPEAGRALASDYAAEPAAEQGKLNVQAEGGAPLVRVPPGGGDGAAYALLAQADPLVEATPAGLQFRLTPLGLEALFSRGHSGPELLRFLRERATAAPPASVRATIERLWQSYGRVRLYDDVTLLELADDYLLPELLAATSLGDAVVHTFSPRLVALDPTKADAVIAELTRRGRPPKVVEGGA